MTEPARTAAEYRAVVFDMDGVVTDAAAVHANVWTALSGADLPALGGAVRSRPGATDHALRHSQPGHATPASQHPPPARASNMRSAPRDSGQIWGMPCPATPRFPPAADDLARCRRQAGAVAR